MHCRLTATALRTPHGAVGAGPRRWLLVRTTTYMTDGVRSCASSSAASAASLGIAPKKRPSAAAPLPHDGAPSIRSATAAARSYNPETAAAAMVAPNVTPKAEASFSAPDELTEKVDQLARMTPQELDEYVKGVQQEEDTASRALVDDGVHQMDVSLTRRYQGAQRVFWKTVSVVPALPATRESDQGWYAVALDGRRVKAFESTVPLVLPSEAYALAVAHEYATQQQHLNKLLMPMTDLASGAQHVQPQAILPRVDYLMSFFRNDNLYFRSPAVVAQQDELIAPVKAWYEAWTGIEVPRIVGLGHPQFPPYIPHRIRDKLIQLEMNPYQIVAFCVIAQHCASLMLPLALFYGTKTVQKKTTAANPTTMAAPEPGGGGDVGTATVVPLLSLQQCLLINRSEEAFNTKEFGEIKGFHDIREQDVIVKVAASAAAFAMTRHMSQAECYRMFASTGASVTEKED